jgi:MFS transporter, FSR family, fosmidomycin resistance protein
MFRAIPRLRALSGPRAIPRGLLVVAIGHLVIELSNNYLPILYPMIMPRLGLSYSQVGFIALVATTAMALFQPLFGYLSDRIGPEVLGAVSVVWIGITMGLVGFAWSYPSLLLLIALGSLGSSAFHPPSAIIAAASSGARRGAGLSIFSVGGSIGVALSPIWMALAFAWFGLPGTVTLIPIGILFGIMMYRESRRVDIGSVRKTRAGGPAAATGFAVGLALIVVAAMFRAWYQVALTTYLPTWVEAGGGTVAMGGQLLAAFSFAASLGSLIGGPMGDRVGHWQVVTGSTLLLSVAHWGMMQSTGAVQVAFLVLAGIAVGATYPTSIIMAMECWPGQVGVASGLVMGLGWWPGGIGAWFTGMLADRWTLEPALATLTFPPLLGFLCMLIYLLLARRRASPPQRL